MSIGNQPIPPESFELNGARYLMQSFGRQGVDATVAGLGYDERQQELTAYMQTIADFVLPNPNGDPQIELGNARFVQAPRIIFSAFMRSRLPEPIKSDTLKRVGITGVLPQEIVHVEPQKRGRALVQEGAASMKRHPEAATLLGTVCRNYEAIDGNRHAAQYAMSGMCFALSQLDHEWQTIREGMIDEAVQGSQAVFDEELAKLIDN